MKKFQLYLLAGTLLASLPLQAQKYFTRSGNVSFHSKALLENIDAVNQQGTFVLDAATMDIQMAVLIKGFQFEKALMQEHFNENYMESDRFPKALFKGKIVSPSKIDLKTAGSFQAEIQGQLTIHGVMKEIRTPATFEVSSKHIKATTNFPVTVADYQIEIPSLVKDKIAKEVEVRIEVSLEEMK